MKSRVITSFAAAGVLALVVSCSQEQTTMAPLPTEASLAKGGPAAQTCSFSTANNDARDYFLDQKDAVFVLLDEMQAAYRTGGASAAATKLAGMKVLARLGTAAQNGKNQVKGTPAQGSLFANDVLRCMGESAIDFTDELGPTGLFAVRDNSTATAVVAHKWDADGYPTTGAPLYGAEPTGTAWPLSQKTLFYGYQLTTATSLADEAPSGAVFELTTLPANLVFAPQIRTGVCDVIDESARILHSHGNDAVILPPAGVPTFCTSPPPLTASRSGFSSMMQVAAKWFTPQPLFAAPLYGGGGGLVSGLSEIGPVTYTSVVSFSNPPRDIKLSKQPQSPAIAVIDTTTNGNPLKGVVITLSVVGNSGSFTNPPQGYQATTNDDGIATFSNLVIDKSGGYTITATSEVGGSATATFNITGN